MPYGERLQKKGLNLLSAPGNDLVAATTLAASGCHMVLFTTGRGTPFGTFVPTMKISTNSTLAKNKPGWIDFNAGVIVENEPMEKTCERFIDYIIKVASGEFVNNEKKGYREIAIFKTGRRVLIISFFNSVYSVVNLNHIVTCSLKGNTDCFMKGNKTGNHSYDNGYN